MDTPANAGLRIAVAFGCIYSGLLGSIFCSEGCIGQASLALHQKITSMRNETSFQSNIISSKKATLSNVEK